MRTRPGGAPLLLSVLLLVPLVLASTPVVAPGRAGGATPVAARRPAAHARRSTSGPAHCPWVTPLRGRTDGELASEVLRHMTLADELDVITLVSTKAYENTTIAVPALCIPALTMQDGPDGLAYRDSGVTQFPAAIGLAASFDPSLAYAEGSALGAQARAQGVDAIQGPYLNLARVPQAGRVFEGYGEDPVLTGDIGVGDVEGIQAAGVLADVKDLGIYTEESDRDFLDQIVSQRALHELYLAPFRAVVTEAGAASIMCGFGKINGVETCQDAALLGAVRSFGFDGFIRDDINAAPDGDAALAAGLDLFKPSLTASGLPAVPGAAARARIAAAAHSVLAEMFRFGLVQRPRTGTTATPVATAAERSVALLVAERGAVLLKDGSRALPIGASTRSIAVIGTPADATPISSGGGSSHVAVLAVVTPLSAIEAEWPRARVTAVPGEPAVSPAAEIPAGDLSPPLPVPPPPPSHPIYHTSRPPTGSWRTWSGVATPTTTGWYRISVLSHGDTYLSVDGDRLLSDPGTHGPTMVQLAYDFVGGHRYSLSMRWFDYDGFVPSVSWQDVSPMILAAASAAARAAVAVVFAGNESTEGADDPSLELSGVQDELIEAVARANRNTVVVLDTGGAVLMPWLSSVRAVLEAWYPGEVDGTAVAALLSGGADPSGRLPVTFPASATATSVPSPALYPGVGGVVDLGAAGDDGLDVGYRYYESHDEKVLFPFGYGLSYTSFSLGHLSVARSGHGKGRVGYVASVTVRDTGPVAGTDVVEAYLHFPAAADEPPLGLEAFAAVSLRAGKATTVQLHVMPSAFETWGAHGFTVVGGRYELEVGTSSADLPLTASITAG